MKIYIHSSPTEVIIDIGGNCLVWRLEVAPAGFQARPRRLMGVAGGRFRKSRRGF